MEVKGLAAETCTILLTSNERRVAEYRRDCYYLYIVTNCAASRNRRNQSKTRHPPLARGQQGAALLAGSGRHDPTNVGAGREAGYSQEQE